MCVREDLTAPARKYVQANNRLVKQAFTRDGARDFTIVQEMLRDSASTHSLPLLAPRVCN